MKRLITTVFVGGALIVAAAGPAFGDAGPPGSTFPEQPNGNVSNACATVLSNPSQGFHDSSVAGNIKSGLVADACFGGP